MVQPMAAALIVCCGDLANPDVFRDRAEMESSPHRQPRAAPEKP